MNTYRVSANKLVVFDSAPEDVEYFDRLILWERDGEYSLDSWHEGERYTQPLTMFEVDEFLDMIGHP